MLAATSISSPEGHDLLHSSHSDCMIHGEVPSILWEGRRRRKDRHDATRVSLLWSHIILYLIIFAIVMEADASIQ